MQQSSFSIIACVIGRPLKFDELVNELKGLAAQWYIFGVQLGVKTDKLDEIGGGRDDASNCLRKVLQAWLEGSYDPCTKEVLLKALRSPTIQNNKLANQIEGGRIQSGWK